jgi:hypothetical protein
MSTSLENLKFTVKANAINLPKRWVVFRIESYENDQTAFSFAHSARDIFSMF